MILLKEILDKIEYCYHSTTQENIPSIARHGLLPSTKTNWGGELGEFSLGKIFVTTKFSMAVYYGDSGPWKDYSQSMFKPVLRFKYNLKNLIKDDESLYDYFTMNPIKEKFELFVPLNNDQFPLYDGNADNKSGEWRELTINIADAIKHGEWDD